MAIQSLDDYITAAKEKIVYTKTQSITTISNIGWWTIRDAVGQPGPMTLPVGNTTTGVVPTDLTTGAPVIAPFGVGNIGYLTGVEFSAITIQRLRIDDLLWYAGAISSTAAATTTFTGNPSYLSRTPDGNGTGCQIWLEVTTAMTTTVPVVTVTYTNQAGTTGRSTGAFTLSSAIAQLTARRWVQLPLQAGDSGVRSIQSVQVNTTSAAGAFNIMVVRPLWMNSIKTTNYGEVNGFEKTGMPIVYATSCLVVSSSPSATSTGPIELLLEISNG